MYKKICNIAFVIIFLAILTIPALLTNWTSGGVSEDENRNLAEFPSLLKDGALNDGFTGEFETWFMDHMGLRQELITANATLQFHVFDRMLDKSDYHIGPYGDINYATSDMLRDYAHLNLRSDTEVAKIGQSYQIISDWLAEQQIPFYYVQCYDKHSIYPEQFTDDVHQNGEISKTDQVITFLEESTTVNTISLKAPLLEAKNTHEVYSNWGDPTHWSPRGSYVGYCYIMERLNQDFDDAFYILQESDYQIDIKNGGITLNKVIHRDDMLEYFTIKDPSAEKSDTSVMGKWAEDNRHSVWINPEAGNNTRLLLMCDSYINSYIIDDFAESFGEVWLVWGDYTLDLPQIVELCDPDLVIYECAERVDRSSTVCKLAEQLAQ